MISSLPELHQRIIEHVPKDLTGSLGVAVSGGSDSLGLLLVLKTWRDAGGPPISAVTVDHGLRPDAADEAAEVGRLCETWGIPHSIVSWHDRPEGGNLSDLARRARYRLMADWAVKQGIGHVAVAHTRDDQAETVLMRLARASGVDGLASMAQSWAQNDVTFLRPALSTTREELRSVLRAANVGWVDDPTNSDPQYERARIRAARPVLEEIGLTPDALCKVAAHMTATREALDACVSEFARKIAHIQHGDVLMDVPGLLSANPELARRVLQSAMRWVSGSNYPPRGPAQLRLLDAIRQGENVTLHGCQFVVSGFTLRLTRELKALENHQVSQDQIWDGRWRLTGRQVPGAQIAALGEAGLTFCPDRASTGLPAVSLRSSPALWQGDTLLSAPLAGFENGWQAELLPRQPHDFAAQITH